MSQQTILNTIAFLKRVQLTGEEVPAFNECINNLNEQYRLLEITTTAESKLSE